MKVKVFMKISEKEKKRIREAAKKKDFKVPLFDLAMFGKFIAPVLQRYLGGVFEVVEEGELLEEEKEKWI